MAIVEMSPALASGLPQRILDVTTRGSSITLTTTFNTQQSVLTPLLPYYYANSYGSIFSLIHIMKSGVDGIPSNLSTLTAVASRAADQLVTFGSASNTDAVFVNTSNPTTNPTIINSLYRAASANGEATWFRWLVYASSGTVIIHQAIGSVGILGSGADLEMSSTNIVATPVPQLYRIINFRMQFATSWDI